ncbi:hypothetical protein ABW365_09155 [Enterococcus avium]
MKAVAAKEGIIAIEDDKQEAIEVMQNLCRDISNLSVIEVPSIYPQGSTENAFYSNYRKGSPSRWFNTRLRLFDYQRSYDSCCL